MTQNVSEAGAASRVGSDLWLRVASSLVLAPLAVAAVWLGGWWFAGFWLLAAIGVMWEWARLTTPRRVWVVTIAGSIVLAGAALVLGLNSPGRLVQIVAAGAVVTALIADERWPVGWFNGWAGAGVLYAAAVVLCAMILRRDPAHGIAAIILLFAVVWSTDIAAYFGGRLMGGPKLWPAVSPKKTWSGALTGTAGAVAAGVAVGYWAGAQNLWALGLVCFLLSVGSQGGDLFESALKRRAGVKDSSHLIPGHGGLMDRLDGFVVAAFLASLIGIGRGGVEKAATGLIFW
ncbi:MAG: phosphatidate cytidylyltransferase [Variibacter sp.]|nr:phosphatidate cytidylyltransferase [Variibacter sp.]